MQRRAPNAAAVTDADCAPGLSDGTGPGLVINANLIMGNAAESGSGGGIRFQAVNGTEVTSLPDELRHAGTRVNVTNNIIANNVAGWDGAGVSLQDALSGEPHQQHRRFQRHHRLGGSALQHPRRSRWPARQDRNCITNRLGTTASCPQPAGLVTMQNSRTADRVSPGTVTCPHAAATGPVEPARTFSYPAPGQRCVLAEPLVLHRRGRARCGTLNQQNIVTLYNAFTTTPAASQPQADATTANGTGAIITGGTGACVTPARAIGTSAFAATRDRPTTARGSRSLRRTRC